MSQGIVSILGLILIPIYITYLGPESYGLLGFLFTLQAIVSLLDLGLSSAVNREVARYVVKSGKLNKINDMVMAMTVLYTVVAILLIITIIF